MSVSWAMSLLSPARQCQHLCSQAPLISCRWLQRDFGIYVVNMFDTGQAARVLQFPGLGLKYLLQHFCNVQVGKKTAKTNLASLSKSL